MLSYCGQSLGIHLESGKLTTNSYACSTVEDVKKYFDAGFNFLVADDPSNERSNATEMNFGSEYGHAICYINGTPVMKTLTEGKLSLTLGAGDGVFVVPVA